MMMGTGFLQRVAGTFMAYYIKCLIRLFFVDTSRIIRFLLSNCLV